MHAKYIEDGKYYVDGELLTGIYEGVYYENGLPICKRVFELDGNIYFAYTNGEILKGKVWVNAGYTNGLIEVGAHYFDEQGKIKGVT